MSRVYCLWFRVSGLGFVQCLGSGFSEGLGLGSQFRGFDQGFRVRFNCTSKTCQVQYCLSWGLGFRFGNLKLRMKVHFNI